MIHAVIMAGGKGTRFWPLSRASKPKQFLSIISEKSLLLDTIDRVKELVEESCIWIVGNKAHKNELGQILNSYPKLRILYEPVSRNTAPCIGWVAHEINQIDNDATLLILPSDHFVSPLKLYLQTLKTGLDFVKNDNCLLTIGIRPQCAHTGYGYIEVKDPSQSVSKVLSFREKPSFETAQEYLDTGRFFWNSGIFIWKASKILSLIEKYLPEVHEGLEQISTDNLDKVFEKFPNISIDYAILEKSFDELKMLQGPFEWSDIGNWSSLEKFLIKDESNNALKGNLVTLNSHDNIVFSKKRIVGLVDISNLIIVESDDALLILPKQSDQRLKQLYDKLPFDLC